jgi:hypothetical protein
VETQNNGAITLANASGTVDGTGGTVVTGGTLTLSGNSVFTLTNDNKVENISAQGAIAGLSFTNTGTATLTVGSINAGTGDITIGNRGASSGTAGDITVNGSLGTASSGTITLRAGINDSQVFGTPGTVTVAGNITAPSLVIEGKNANRSSGTVTAAVTVHADNYPTDLFAATSSGTTTFIARSSAHLELNDTGTATITEPPYVVAIPAGSLTGSLTPHVLRTDGNIYITGAVIPDGQSLTLKNSGFIDISGGGLTMTGASVLVLDSGFDSLRLNGGSINISGDFSVPAVPVLVGDGGNIYNSNPSSAGSVKAANITISGTVNGTETEGNNLTLEAAGAIYITGAVGGTRRLGDIAVNNGAVGFDSEVNAKSYIQAAGSANFNAAQNHTAGFSFTGTDLILKGMLTADGAVAIANTGAFRTAAAISAGGAFSQTTTAGTVHIGANITTRNSTALDASISFAGAVELTGDVVLDSSAGGGDITLSDDVTRDAMAHGLALNAGDGAVNAGGSLGTSASPLGAIAVTGVVITANGINSSAKTEILNSGLFTSSSAIVSNGGFEQRGSNTGSSVLKADITTANTSITFNQPITIDASTALTLNTGTGAGDISLAAVNGPGKDLALAAGGGNITVSGVVGNSTDRLGVLKTVSAADVTFVSAAAVTAASFTQDAGTGTTAFNGTQDYTGGFTFTGTNLTVNNTLQTDTDNSGDGAITVAVSGSPGFTVGAAGSILPGGLGGKIAVRGSTVNNGTITAVAANIPVPIEFDGDYTSASTGTLNGSDTGNAADPQTIVFKGSAAFGVFTHNGDTVRFSTGTDFGSAHGVSKTGGGTIDLTDVIIDAGNTVTVASGTTVIQDPAGTGSTLTMNGGAALITIDGSWYIGPSGLPSPWYMLSDPASSPTGALGDPNYINLGPPFDAGFAGFHGTLDMGNGARLETKDFYTRITDTINMPPDPPEHMFTLKAPSGGSETCAIKASGNVTINETFNNPGHVNFTMDGGGLLAVRTAPNGTNPRTVYVDLWNFTVDGSGAVINSDVNFRRSITITGNLTGGTSSAPSPRIHILPDDSPSSPQATWTQTGTFSPRLSVVEFGYEDYNDWLAVPRNYTIAGSTTWYDFVCREKGAVIRFSQHPDIHAVSHNFVVNPVSAGDNPTIPPWSTYKKEISIKLDRIDPPNDLKIYLKYPLPPPNPEDEFWVFKLEDGAMMNINFVRIKYSYSTRRLPVPPELDFNWYVKAWPYYDDPLDPVNSPIESFWDVNWFVFNNFFYSYTEDEDHNGKIDRIRAQSAFEVDGNFSDFDVSVDGYEIDRNRGSNGFSRAGASYDKIDSIYIYLKEKDYTDGGAVLRWRITRNGSLKDLTVGSNTIGNVGEEMITIDTVPPRLNYALTVPELAQVYFQMSEPVNHTALSKEGAAPIKVTNVDTAHVASGVPALRIINSRSFSDRYGTVGDGALEYRFDLDTAYTVGELFNGGKTFDLEDVYDMAAPARDLRADKFIDRTDFIDPRFYYQYPSPKYPTGWDYGKYVYVIYNTLYGDKKDTRPDRSKYEQNPPGDPALIPPHRLADLSSLTPPYAPPTGGYDYSVTHRVTDVLISVPPKDKDDTRYFVWPIWAGYMDPANPTAVGNDKFWDEQVNDTGIIWDFTGAKTLEDRDTTIQVRVNSGLAASVPVLQSAAQIPESYHARPVDSNGYGHGNPGFTLPSVPGKLPPSAGTPPDFTNLVPGYYPFTNADRVSPAGSLFTFNLKEAVPGYESGGRLEFLLRLENSPPDLFAARLDIPRGAEVPENWYQLVRPFSYGIRNVTLQRGGATILNNVINPNNGERTYIRYHLVKGGRVTVQVFTLDGTLVKILRRENRSAGEWIDSWDGTNNGGRAVARGMYFIRVVGPDIDEIRKVMVVK